jgi:signal transduction histidine kinase/type II secretory pathway pseudopilin PulG
VDKTQRKHPALRKRIVVIFIVAILMPSLVLSYLGLQSVRQEQDRQKEVYLRNLEQSLSIALSRVESEVEDHLQAIIGNLPVPEAMTGNIFYHQVRYVISQSPLVSNAFILDHDLRVHFPRSLLPDQSRSRQPGYQDRELFRQAVASEAGGKLDDAIAHYRAGLHESGSDLETMALLNGIARCQMKKKNLADAGIAFRRIIEMDRGRFLGGEVPLILLAYYQLSGIEAEISSSAAALNTMLDFYGLLSDNFQHLQPAQHAFYLSGIKGKLDASLATATETQADRFLEIRDREMAAEAERAFRFLFDDAILPVCRANLKLAREGHELRYLRLQAAGEQLLIAMKTSTVEPAGDAIKGILLNDYETRRLLSHAIATENARGNASLLLFPPGSIHAGAGEAGENQQVLVAGFSSIRDLFPGFVLGIDLQQNSEFKNIFRRTARLYYILFTGITGIILFGIIFIFRDMYREQQLSQIKSAFLANVSHEIKNPVATIRLLAGNLAEGIVNKQEKQMAYFRHISREAEKLSYLTENILDFSSLAAQRKFYRKEVVSLEKILKNALQRFYLIHKEEETVVHEVIPAGLPEIMASPEGVEQAVLNLLDNAAKYSGNKKDIRLVLEQNEKEAVISVSDEGIGIARDKQEKIFERFYRVENAGIKSPGSGIGLSLVREIARMHNGSIEVESKPGKGSKFSLKIPVNHAKNIADRR